MLKKSPRISVRDAKTANAFTLFLPTTRKGNQQCLATLSFQPAKARVSLYQLTKTPSTRPVFIRVSGLVGTDNIGCFFRFLGGLGLGLAGL